jgi:protein-tyrosine phosphatase
MFNSILLVCTANVCRSPIAEALFRSHLPDKIIASAGIKVEKLNYTGHAPDPMAIDVANRHHLSLVHHQAQPLTLELAEQYDLILVMTPTQQQQVMNIAPSLGAKTLLIGQWIGLSTIDDPFGKNHAAFERCFHDLQRAALSWKEKLAVEP